MPFNLLVTPSGLGAREEGEDGNRISEFSETQNVLAAKKVAIELTQDSRYTAQKGGDFTTFLGDRTAILCNPNS